MKSCKILDIEVLSKIAKESNKKMSLEMKGKMMLILRERITEYCPSHLGKPAESRATVCQQNSQTIEFGIGNRAKYFEKQKIN